MTHRNRILRVVRPENGGPRSRPVLEGLARTDKDRRAASALIDYMIALGELVQHGETRATTYGLPKRRAG